jgi:hypothetical protein
MSVSVFSRSWVCLDQLEKAAIKNGGIFNPSTSDRKELICDMDTSYNKWLSVYYHIQHAF